MFTSMSVNGSPADGYSSGQAIKAIEEVAAQSLPTGYGFEFSGMTREEQSSSGSTTAMIFALCFVFVYLLLSAQYESYILPLVVLLSVPSGLMGSFIFAQIMGVENNIYMQIALIMLIGLLAKNAILITENRYEHYRSSRIGSFCPVTPYLNDLPGYGHRIAAADVRSWSRSQR